MTRIRSVEAVPLAATFKQAFSFGTTTRTTSPNVVIVVRTDDGVAGHGEACPVPAFTSETQASVVALVEDVVAPLLVGRDVLDRHPLLASLAAPLTAAPFTLAGVDTALLDASARTLEVPVHGLLGGAFRHRLEVHGSVGWQEDPAAMVGVALDQVEAYTWLKLYAGRGELDEDLRRLAAVRDAVGADARLQVDVNTMWTPAQLAQALPALLDIGVEMVEQPVARTDEPALRDLVNSGRVAVAADESVRTVQDAARVASERTATTINVGHSKLGGPTAAFAAAQVAAAHGVAAFVGSVLEMGIGNAMGLHLAAALPELSHPSYLIGPLKYAQQLTVEPLVVRDAHVEVPTGPGLGVTVDQDVLRALDARRR